MKVAVSLPGMAEPFQGTVRRISPEVDAQTRLGSIRVTLPPNEAARAGSFARGVVEVERREALAVPSSSVVFEGREAFLQVVVDGVVRTTPVTLGIRAGELIEVTSGLSEGQEVVARAGTFVADGDRVTPVRDETVGAVAP